MVENTLLEYLKELFSEYACKEKILFFPNRGFSNYEIETKFGYALTFYYEYVDNLYNVKIRYSSNVLSLTSYDLYKKFVKKNLKGILFKKHNLKEHFDVLLKFIINYNDKIKSYDEFIKELSLTKKGYENIFV